jgi:hypothetical protein
MVAEMLSARCQDTSYGEKILSSQRSPLYMMMKSISESARLFEGCFSISGDLV